MKNEDIDFLRNLQVELRKQDEEGTDGQAAPRYWGITETKKIPLPDGCGVPHIIYNYNEYEKDEFIELIEAMYESKLDEDWHNAKDGCIDDLVDYVTDKIGVEVPVFCFGHEDVLSKNTGCFLTKNAAQEHIKKYGYNYSNPRAYAMTAYRNFEFERLLNIITNLDIDALKVDE